MVNNKNLKYLILTSSVICLISACKMYVKADILGFTHASAYDIDIEGRKIFEAEDSAPGVIAARDIGVIEEYSLCREKIMNKESQYKCEALNKKMEEICNNKINPNACYLSHEILTRFGIDRRANLMKDRYIDDIDAYNIRKERNNDVADHNFNYTYIRDYKDFSKKIFKYSIYSADGEVREIFLDREYRKIENRYIISMKVEKNERTIEISDLDHSFYIHQNYKDNIFYTNHKNKWEEGADIDIYLMRSIIEYIYPPLKKASDNLLFLTHSKSEGSYKGLIIGYGHPKGFKYEGVVVAVKRIAPGGFYNVDAGYIIYDKENGYPIEAKVKKENGDLVHFIRI